MLQSFVITLREGLEAFLIVAISLAYLKKTGRQALFRRSGGASAFRSPLSIGAGVLLAARNQALWEGMLALVAAVLVGDADRAHVAHRPAHEAPHRGTPRASAAKTGAAAFLGVFGFTLLMITREGMETALLMNTLLFQVQSLDIIAGAVAGTLVAAFVAWLWSRYGHRVNLARFFQVTAVFLLVFVVQLLIYGFHELTEPTSSLTPAVHWATEPYGPDGRYGQFLTYLLVVLPLGWLALSNFFKPRARPPSDRRRRIFFLHRGNSPPPAALEPSAFRALPL